MVSSNGVKVFKKTAPNGKITVYLGSRDFVDNSTTTEPIDGVVLVDQDYLRGRNIYAAVNVTYRFGREEDEVMGLHFSKDIQVTCQEIPLNNRDIKATEVQERLLNKLGANASPFMINIPETSPSSVQLHPGSEETAKPLGVIYELKIFVGENSEDKPHRRNSVTLAVRKIQYAPTERFTKQPSTLASKGFTFSSGKLNMEVTLDKELFYHGEQVRPIVNISNNSKKTVKGIRCSVMQHVEVTMNNQQFTREVAGFDTKEGCPITPGCHYQKEFTLIPLASNKTKFGMAMDGKIKDGDSNLASSTLKQSEHMGIEISYTARVRLNCGALGGELVADLPFKLMHPLPGHIRKDKRQDKRQESLEFEEFSKLRRGQSVDDNLDV